VLRRRLRSATKVLYELPTQRATRRLAARLAPLLAGGDLVVLSGPLGAGKTFFARALCVALGVEARHVTSPTFSLIHELTGRLAIAHADLYRLRSPAELVDLGLDALRDDGRLLLVEWGESYVDALGGDALRLELSLEPRRARFSAGGTRSNQVLAALREMGEALDAPGSPG
jgi:tRNA threonylcarbamoyladenosine biosynthesis protein TsaE